MSVYRKEQKLWCCTKSSLLAGPFCYSGGFSIALHIHTLVPVDITPGLLEASKSTCSRGISGTTNEQLSASSGSISPLIKKRYLDSKEPPCLFAGTAALCYLSILSSPGHLGLLHDGNVAIAHSQDGCLTTGDLACQQGVGQRVINVGLDRAAQWTRTELFVEALLQ